MKLMHKMLNERREIQTASINYSETGVATSYHVSSLFHISAVMGTLYLKQNLVAVQSDLRYEYVP